MCESKTSSAAWPRDRIMPQIRYLAAGFSCEELTGKLEGSGIPFAPISRPQDMFDDPHLEAGRGLENVRLPGGTLTKLPALPITMNGARLHDDCEMPPPGAHTREVLQSLGY